MDISKLKLFELMQTNLTYLGERHDVLSQNVANASVPGYVPKDVEKPDFEKMLNSAYSSESTLAVTNAKHIGGISATASGGSIVENDKPFEVKPSGNGVVLEDQVMELSKNSMEYQKTTNIYRRMMEMLKTAIGNV